MTSFSQGRSSMSLDEEPPDTTVYIRISLPEHKLQRCLQFQLNETIFEAKQRILAFFGKDSRNLKKHPIDDVIVELRDGLNYGLYCPPLNGRAGKFLDEERPLRDYPLPGPIGFLEFKYKRRVYKMMQFNPHKIKKQHTKANLKQFMEAVKHGNATKVTKFTCKGLDPNFQELDSGETPLTIAVSLPKPRDLILALVGGGAHVDFRNKRSLTPMHKGAMTGNHEALKVLLELGASPNYHDGGGLTPLYYSACNDVSATCVELLLHERSIISIQDEQGWAEIHQVCRYGRVQHLEHLLFYGADMNMRNASGNTPLHVCAVNNQESCARVLLFRGADKTLENFSSQTPFQVAIIANNVDLADVIKTHSSQEVVPFKEPPHYTDRRRSCITPLQSQLVRSRSDPRLDLSHLRECFNAPDTISLSARSMVESSSSSTLVDTSRTNSYKIGKVPQRSLSVCSSASGYDSMVYAFPKKRLYAALPGRSFVCIRAYKPTQHGELELVKGDFVEVLSVGEEGYWEGKVGQREGWFPSEHVQEVIMRRRGGPATDDSVVLKRNTLAALVNTESENTAICVVLQRAKSGYGFVLRGARSHQSSTSTLDFIPSADFPALQYLDNVERNGMADKAGLKKGDFVLEINGENVVRATHEHAVKLIKLSKDSLAMKVVRVKSPHDGVWRVEQVETTSTLPSPTKKKAPKPPKRDPSTSLSVGRARAKSMYEGLSQLEQTLAHYDSDGGSLRSSNSYESLAALEREKTASIRSRPSSQKISNKQLEELFARQGSSEQAVPVQAYTQKVKPTIHVPQPKYASPAQMRANKYKHKRKAADSLGVSHSLSTPNLGQVDELDDDTDSLSSLSTDKGIVMNPVGMTVSSQMNGRRVSMDSQHSSSSQLSDGVLIPPPPNYPPPLPPREDGAHEVVKIQPNTGVTYANISQELQQSRSHLPPVESSFRPGKVAQLNTHKNVTKEQVISHHRNNSYDKKRVHQPQAMDHSRTASLPDHTRIVPGSVHQVAARFEQKSHPPQHPSALPLHPHDHPQPVLHEMENGVPRGVTFADDRVFENAARFMKDHPNATMLVTSEMSQDTVDHTPRSNRQEAPYFSPPPDYDEPSPDYETTNMDLDDLQKLVSDNKAFTDSWVAASGIVQNSGSDHSKTPSPPKGDVNIPQRFGSVVTHQQPPPPPSMPPPSLPVVHQMNFQQTKKVEPPPATKPPTPPPPVRTTAALQKKDNGKSNGDAKETFIIPKAPIFAAPKPPNPPPPMGVKAKTPNPPPPPLMGIGRPQSPPQMGVGAVQRKINSNQPPQKTTEQHDKPMSGSALQNALKSAVLSRQQRNVDTEVQIPKEKESKPNYENDLLAAVAKRQSRMKDSSGSMVVRNMEKSIEERKKQNVATNDPAAALAAAVAKRRSIIESGGTDDLHSKIEKEVAKSKKMHSTRYGKTVEKKEEKTDEKPPSVDSGKTSPTVKTSQDAKEVNDTKGQNELKTVKSNESLQSNYKSKQPPLVAVKSSHSKNAPKGNSTQKTRVKIVCNSDGDRKEVKQGSPGPSEIKNENAEKNLSQTVTFDKSLKSEGKSGFTAKASEKLEWLKQRRLSQPVDKTDVEKAMDAVDGSANKAEDKPSRLKKELSVEIDGVTTDQSSSDMVPSVQDSANELSKMLNSTNNKISQLSPRAHNNGKMNGGVKQEKPNVHAPKSDIKPTSNGTQNGTIKGKSYPIAIPPPLGLFDDPTLIETNIDEGVDALPPPPEFFVNGVDGGDTSHRMSTDALPPPPPPSAFSHTSSRPTSEDTVSLISTTSSLSTLSSDNGGVDHSAHMLPLHEYSSMDAQLYSVNSQKYEPLAEVPPPPPMEFGDDDPSTSSGYGSVIMGDAEHLYEEVGYREVVPPPADFNISPDTPSSDGSLKTVISVNFNDDVEQSEKKPPTKTQTFRNKPIHKWNCDDVGDWLVSLNLSEYRECFVDNMIDGENLTKLTRDEYFELGVTRIGHRMNMERAIKQCQGVRL